MSNVWSKPKFNKFTALLTNMSDILVQISNLDASEKIKKLNRLKEVIEKSKRMKRI